MFSRFSVVGNQGLARCILSKYQPASTVTTSSSSTSQVTAESSKRDLVNFPRRSPAQYAPPTRFGFIPDSWFQYFYPKTGVTGPYVFMASVGTYLFSKEIIVFDHNIVHAISFSMALSLIYYKFGDKIGAAYNKALEEKIKSLNAPQEAEKEGLRENISYLESKKNLPAFVSEVMKAKKETIYLQLEAAYRQRVTEVHKKVKNLLDCKVELQNVETRIAQRNLVDYVVKNVLSSITPEQEKIALQNCISELNALAAKA